MIKAAFFDVDGTLVSHKIKAVPESSRRALDKLGFTHCGTIICDEGTPRCAYQKDL